MFVTALKDLPSPSQARKQEFKALITALLLGVIPTPYKDEALLVISDLTTISQQVSINQGSDHQYIEKLNCQFKIGNFTIPSKSLFSCTITKDNRDYIKKQLQNRQLPGEYINSRKNKLDDDFLFASIGLDIFERDGVIAATCNKLRIATDAKDVYNMFYETVAFYRVINILKQKCRGQYFKSTTERYGLNKYFINNLDKDHDVESQSNGAPASKIRKITAGSNLLFNHAEEDSQAPLFPETQKNKETQSGSIIELEEEEEEEIPMLQIPSTVVPGSTSIPFGSSTGATNSTLATSNSSYDGSPIYPVSLTELLMAEEEDPGTHLGRLYEIHAKVVGMLPYKPFIIKPYKRTMKIAPFKLVLKSGENVLLIDLRVEEDLCGFFGICEVEEIYSDIRNVEKKVYKLLHDGKTRRIMVKRRVKHIESDDTMTFAYWTMESTLDKLLE
ncbi:uncharacterized protein SPAPADRAFT_63262 [Spathaspora passalidarum NRRL Y-27907]|uniref:Uncharacterized protein n=1 Tax=Spathaspora passalidarum (strain NRRL Y-27907 / 11-Y1) TaxID=619300 RepID=G3AU37_SPAPN|nr:uncharacterized protein SPAPADRAFT_63262 [Spathaspora passalidarum NRRL Y-27907]EGW30414.1 hypothetical protein SPAPADRAFT_63262 [Spathaspora passalidarum NRRL Y-27907]